MMDNSGQNLTRFRGSLPAIRIVFGFSSLIALGMTAVAVAQDTPSYYVSGTNGNDSWSGTLTDPNSANTDGPFKTLARAQSAMRASSTIKTTNIRSGTYSIQFTNLTFASQDSGESWIRYPGETAILDGAGMGYISNAGADNLTFTGLVFQNLGIGPYGAGMNLRGSGHIVRWNKFLNCKLSCLSASRLTDAVIDNNTMNGQSPGNPAGNTGYAYSAIDLWYGSSNNRVTHNLITNIEGGGIAFSAGRNDPPNNNNIVDRNIFRNVNTNVVDSGAIYMMDRTHSAVGNQITNNIIDGNGGINFLNNWTKAIYLDDLMSNVLVSGNVCRNCGQYALQYHAGDHNNVVNNVFDLSGGALLGLYQNNTLLTGYGMAGNAFENNIVYFSSTVSNSPWVVKIGSSDALPAVATNLYYSATGASISNSGQIVDANPVYADPQFTNPSGGDYSMTLTSPAYTQIQFQPLPTDQGPVPQIIPPTNLQILNVIP